MPIAGQGFISARKIVDNRVFTCRFNNHFKKNTYGPLVFVSLPGQVGFNYICQSKFRT